MRPRPHHRRTNSDPLGNEGGDLDLDNPALTHLLDFDPSELFPMGRPTSFDEEAEKQLLDAGEYYAHSPRSRPDSGNFTAILDGIPASPFGSPISGRPYATNEVEAMQVDQLPPPPPRASPPQQHSQFATKAAQKKGHRRTASEPYFSANLGNGMAAENSIFAARTEPPRPALAAAMGPPAPRRMEPPRPMLQTIPSQRDLPFSDGSQLGFQATPTSIETLPPAPEPMTLVHPEQPPPPPPHALVVPPRLPSPPREQTSQSIGLTLPRGPSPPKNGGASASIKKETKTYKCSRCGQIKANHVCRAVLYDSVAVAVQADPTKLIQTYGERTIVVRHQPAHPAPPAPPN